MNEHADANTAGRPGQRPPPPPGRLALIACAIWIIALTAIFISLYSPSLWLQLQLPVHILFAAMARLPELVHPLFYRDYVF